MRTRVINIPGFAPRAYQSFSCILTSLISRLQGLGSRVRAEQSRAGGNINGNSGGYARNAEGPHLISFNEAACAGYTSASAVLARLAGTLRYFNVLMADRRIESRKRYRSRSRLWNSEFGCVGRCSGERQLSWFCGFLRGAGLYRGLAFGFWYCAKGLWERMLFRLSSVIWFSGVDLRTFAEFSLALMTVGNVFVLLWGGSIGNIFWTYYFWFEGT